MRINRLEGIKEVIDDAGIPMVLRYYLVQDDGEKEPAYGVGIVKYAQDGTEEREWIPGISHSKEQTKRLLEQMMEGVVTPSGAVAIVDDWEGA